MSHSQDESNSYQMKVCLWIYRFRQHGYQLCELLCALSCKCHQISQKLYCIWLKGDRAREEVISATRQISRGLGGRCVGSEERKLWKCEREGERENECVKEQIHGGSHRWSWMVSESRLERRLPPSHLLMNVIKHSDTHIPVHTHTHTPFPHSNSNVQEWKEGKEANRERW